MPLLLNHHHVLQALITTLLCCAMLFRSETMKLFTRLSRSLCLRSAFVIPSYEAATSRKPSIVCTLLPVIEFCLSRCLADALLALPHSRHVICWLVTPGELLKVAALE